MKKDRRFIISPDEIYGPFDYDSREETFRITLYEYGNEDRAGKSVEVSLAGCFEWQIARLLEKLFELQRKEIQRREDNIKWAKNEIRGVVE